MTLIRLLCVATNVVRGVALSSLLKKSTSFGPTVPAGKGSVAGILVTGVSETGAARGQAGAENAHTSLALKYSAEDWPAFFLLSADFNLKLCVSGPEFLEDWRKVHGCF